MGKKKAAKNADGNPRFLKNGKATGTPASAPQDEEKNLPSFLRSDADQTQIIGHLIGQPEHSPAMQNFEGAPPAGTVDESFKSTSSDAKARRTRNLRDLARKSDVIDTTYHTDLE